MKGKIIHIINYYQGNNRMLKNFVNFYFMAGLIDQSSKPFRTNIIHVRSIIYLLPDFDFWHRSLTIFSLFFLNNNCKSALHLCCSSDIRFASEFYTTLSSDGHTIADHQ